MTLGPAAIMAATLFGLIGFAVVFVTLFFVLNRQGPQQRPLTGLEQEALTPPAPRLDITPAIDRAATETAARDKLQGFAWINQAAGRVRIPIDRAMQVLAQQGWPDDKAGKP
jgi:hypothetical protein